MKRILDLRLLGTSVLGATGVMLGALGAHAWKPALEAANRVDAWNTAVLYHLIHAVALLALPLDHRFSTVIRTLWLGGVLLFSGSLYWLSLGGPRFLGPVTPLGGLFLIGGWLFVAAGLSKRNP